MPTTLHQLMQDVSSIQMQKDALDQQLKSYKNDFEAFIKDSSISFFDRWNAFAQAPSELKNHSPYVPSARSALLNTKIHSLLNRSESYGRGYLFDVLDFFADAYNVEDQMFYPSEYDMRCTLNEASTYTPEEMQQCEMFALMEELMQRNLGSFRLDW